VGFQGVFRAPSSMRFKVRRQLRVNLAVTLLKAGSVSARKATQENSARENWGTILLMKDNVNDLPVREIGETTDSTESGSV
jgi:hypothetical protein